MATWYISDDLPYLNEFPELMQTDDAPESLWKIADNLPYKVMFPDMPAVTDAPESLWRIIEGDLPFKVMFPKMYGITNDHSQPIKQSAYICVFDMHNPQNQFDDNGICILAPSKCEIAEELNGLYELTLEHPIDKEGRWTYLLELNIIKAGGQLWRIYSKNTKLNSDGSKLRTVKARHIFYDLNDRLLTDVRPENKNGVEFIDWIFNHIYEDDPEHYYPQFTFAYDSDITDTATSYFLGTSVTAALLGADNCFLNRLGGELYRDNFYFSINQHKEDSEQNSFDIVYGVDMIDVEETIDYSDMLTKLIAKDNHGNEWKVFYEDTPRIAHHITKLITFNYDEEDEAAFHKDANNYFYAHSQPRINYKVTFANLKNADLYKGFIGLRDRNVGDTGTILCEELGITTIQRIVKKTVDLLTGNTISVELGNLVSSLTRTDKYAGRVDVGDSASIAAKAAAEEARKAFAASLKTWGDCRRYKWKDLKVLRWGEVYKQEVS